MDNEAYVCVFTRSFFPGRIRNELLGASPLLNAETFPYIPLNPNQSAYLTTLYHRMLSAHSTEYGLRDELIKNCIELLIHEWVRIQPNPSRQSNGSTRITHLFFELLEQQFPIESSLQALSLSTPKDFAERISVHVNYLNRSVKIITGKSTAVHIRERIVAEARNLLKHSNWNISEISNSLGFKYSTHFNTYFKKTTGFTPNDFRQENV